ncbi:FtsW/RodA/SpoVE family cell cycle protein [Spirosoma rhododendri]|uniref:Probable peptidoglycan glycosyltransferase FtsW n=1 Tax=Spirosoma rhododendri TaxID=2728024 RepID=A0A7L5DM56_9BACT|nr:FtsW/RodA/SpoVE family cell cycle protein [Spirosoma rhododendri]QJD78612.1 FtsW/RodA/SpoVE family cell cycle protein [Spirosoma rhododendri]
MFSFATLFRTYLKGDRQIWWIVFYLSVMSVLVVYSATSTRAFREANGDTESFLFQHGMLLILGLGCMFWAHKANYLVYAQLSRYGLWLSVVLLLWAFFKGTSVNDASRWVTIPFLNRTVQPSDLAKLALISNLAAMLAKRQKYVDDPSVLVNMILWIGAICFLVILTSTSTALMLGATCFLLMYIGRVPVKYLVIMVCVCVFFGGVGLFFGQRFGTASNRIKNFTSSETVGFQVKQSYIALANGGLTGQGPGNSHQRNILPFPFSDFIFAIIIEEYGLLFGGIPVVLAYLWFLWRGIKTIDQTTRPFGGLLAAGLTFSLVIQAFASMCVAIGLAPVTGQPLPLLSMGGTSLVFTGLAFGIVLSVSREQVDERAIVEKK